MLMIRSACLGLLLAGSLAAGAQKHTFYLGAKWTHDLTLNHGIARGGGLQAGYGLSKKSSIETGISYTTWDRHFYSGNSDGVYESVVAERHLFIPLQYRYQSGNFIASGGVAADFFLGWHYKKTTPGIPVRDLQDPGITLLTTAGVSRSFRLCSSVFFEPELRLNYRPGSNDGSLGLNLGLRKTF